MVKRGFLAALGVATERPLQVHRGGDQVVALPAACWPLPLALPLQAPPACASFDVPLQQYLQGVELDLHKHFRIIKELGRGSYSRV